MSNQTIASTHPSCYGWFDPITPECASCLLSGDCMKEQAQQVQHLCESLPVSAMETETNTEPDTEILEELITGEDETDAGVSSPNCQIIPKHLRKPLEIPPVGTQLRTVYKGKTYKALVIDDPTNPRSGGRSICFKGETYQTLTAAAHAIAPGINSGTVWQTV